jgi:hypothetical protein
MSDSTPLRAATPDSWPSPTRSWPALTPSASPATPPGVWEVTELSRFATKWAAMSHWLLLRRDSVQDALPEVVRMQLRRYRTTRQATDGKTSKERAYFEKLAQVPEQAVSLGTLACCKGKACQGCWKAPRPGRRTDRICNLGTLCRFCHCHLTAKPNTEKKNRSRQGSKPGSVA